MLNTSRQQLIAHTAPEQSLVALLSRNRITICCPPGNRNAGRHDQISFLKAPWRLRDLFQTLSRTATRAFARQLAQSEGQGLPSPAFSFLASWLETNTGRIPHLAASLSWYVSSYSDTVFGIRRAPVAVETLTLNMLIDIASAARKDAVLDALVYLPQTSQVSDDQALAAYREALLRQSPNDCRHAKSAMESVVENRVRLLAGI